MRYIRAPVVNGSATKRSAVRSGRVTYPRASCVPAKYSSPTTPAGTGRNRESSTYTCEFHCGRPIGTVVWRQRTAVEGRVRSVSVSPISGSPTLEAELYDPSGGITLVFYGRRTIPGIEPGALLRAEGMVGEMEGHLAMANPTYSLLPREDAEE